jgi:hypothetical protein
VRRPLLFAIGSVLVTILVAGCASRTASAVATTATTATVAATATSAAPAGATTAPSPAASTSAPVQVHVAACPVPARDYAGTPFSPHAAPAATNLPAAVPLPANAQIFGTEFMPGGPSYLLGPKSAACQGGLASADGGESMTATQAADRSEAVTMTIHAGGVGPSTDLACPYIPAVYAADQAFRQGSTFCAHPSADVIGQIPTGTASLYAAAVLVPARVRDPNLRGSGDGTDRTVALYTAQVSSDAAAGQMIACTLAPAEADICAASLKFFLATQAQISKRISAANLTKMEAALASFLAGPDIH